MNGPLMIKQVLWNCMLRIFCIHCMEGRLQKRIILSFFTDSFHLSMVHVRAVADWFPPGRKKMFGPNFKDRKFLCYKFVKTIFNLKFLSPWLKDGPKNQQFSLFLLSPTEGRCCSGMDFSLPIHITLYFMFYFQKKFFPFPV